MITRIAPTPSGYLHVGNCVNALLVSWLAAEAGGHVILRIDDLDAERYRSEYVDDILRVLPWLGVDWDEGPRSRAEFESAYALRDRTERYRAELIRLMDDRLAYACECSRADLRAAGTRACARDCRERRLPLVPGKTAVRVHVPEGTMIDVGEVSVDLYAEVGDFIVWRRDDQPAYHLASVVEDRDHDVTHIVRGIDLLPSTAAQLFLAPLIDAPEFGSVQFLHHPLVTGADGHKLSKSQLAGGPLQLDEELAHQVRQGAIDHASPLGITPGAVPR